MQVTELWRYPVKSLRGEQLDEATVGVHGITGDRGWGIVDLSTDNILTARREPSLLFAAAELDGDDVVITLPDGSIAADDAALSGWLGKDVALRKAAMGVTGTFENSMDWEHDADWIAWDGPEGSFHDSGRTMVSLCGTTIARQWDRRRFRQNVWLRDTDEVELVGHEVAVGSVSLSVRKQIDRCVMVTRPQPGVERDLSVLKSINNDMDTFLGVAATVSVGGRIALGDDLTLA